MLLMWFSMLLWLGMMWLEFLVLVWCLIRFLNRLFSIEVNMVMIVVMVRFIRWLFLILVMKLKFSVISRLVIMLLFRFF